MAEKKEYKPGIKKIKSFLKGVFAEKPGSPKAKRKRAAAKATADVEKDLPRGKPSPEVMEDKPKTFSEAFKRARMQGVDEFMFGGKEYASVTKEELGSKSLREYLNEKRQDSQRQKSDQE